MIILGIESSCDDTAAAIVKNGKEILSNIRASQDEFHREYYGVVPEIAARKHLQCILPLIEKSIKKAHVTEKEIDHIAVTTHPGLLGSLLIGVIAAKTLAYTWGKGLVAVNHLLAHMYSVHMTNCITYPYIGLLVSGGHTLLLHARSVLDIRIIGTTADDACGEAFDKVAKHLGLGYPGGPVIDKLAGKGDAHAVDYPFSSMKDKHGKYNVSYSGLKTAVIYQTDKFKKKKNPTKADIVASFQKKAIDTLYIKVKKAVEEYSINTVCIAGGVAANSYLRKIFSEDKGIQSFFPPLGLCIDNGAMVAGFAYHKIKHGDIEKEKSRLNPFARIIKSENLI
ncbi:tRNA (adenosine(37)-N6)-threonylcarbamoyltransferase complex transferase subunit TsaD [Spirochaetota bacterium]